MVMIRMMIRMMVTMMMRKRMMMMATEMTMIVTIMMMRIVTMIVFDVAQPDFSAQKHDSDEMTPENSFDEEIIFVNLVQVTLSRYDIDR